MTESSLVRMGPYVLRVVANPDGISKIEISKQPYRKGKKSNKNIDQLEAAIRRYEEGDTHAFDAVSLDVAGTDFRRKVWKATCDIPYGETRTYAEIAAAIGSPKAVRAVGTALGRNPVCIAVPCHRVVPAAGGIGQYAHGKAVKRWLLDHEAGRV